MKTIMMLPTKNRVKVRELLQRHKELTLDEIKSLTSPLQNRLKMIRKVLSNEMTLDQYLIENKKIECWLKNLLHIEVLE